MEAGPADSVHWVEDVLRYADTDANGHVNNTVFSVLCESGRVALFAEHLTPLLERGTFFVIARLAIDFRAELHYPGTVRTGTWIAAVGRSSIRFGQEIRSGEIVSGETVAASAESVCVLMDRATRRSTPLPDRVRAAAEALLRPDA
jgi:acyl-CoA thioester hydrolase